MGLHKSTNETVARIHSAYGLFEIWGGISSSPLVFEQHRHDPTIITNLSFCETYFLNRVCQLLCSHLDAVSWTWGWGLSGPSPERYCELLALSTVASGTEEVLHGSQSPHPSCAGWGVSGLSSWSSLSSKPVSVHLLPVVTDPFIHVRLS